MGQTRNDIPIEPELDGFRELPFEMVKTLEQKVEALMEGKILYVKNFERGDNGRDVMVRINSKRYQVSQISWDIHPLEGIERYWTTYNVGINDISLLTTYIFTEGTFIYSNRFLLEDVVEYVSIDGERDTALVEKVFVSEMDDNVFMYKLSRDLGYYKEEDLVKNKYL